MAGPVRKSARGLIIGVYGCLCIIAPQDKYHALVLLHQLANGVFGKGCPLILVTIGSTLVYAEGCVQQQDLTY